LHLQHAVTSDHAAGAKHAALARIRRVVDGAKQLTSAFPELKQDRMSQMHVRKNNGFITASNAWRQPQPRHQPLFHAVRIHHAKNALTRWIVSGA